MSDRLKFRMSSLQHTDPVPRQKADLATAVPDVHADYRPDFIGFTELSAFDTINAVTVRCKQTGYELFRKASVGLAVNNTVQVMETGWVDVLDPLRSPTGHGSHTRRGVLEVTALTLGGVTVTVHVAHWVTDAPTPSRTAKRWKQSDVMAERVRMHGEGRRVAFWMGDTNEDEGKKEGEVQRRLTRGGLISIYDALDKYPDTHGRKTIDVVGHYEKDRRVVPKKVSVGPHRHSDHRLVDAIYLVLS